MGCLAFLLCFLALLLSFVSLLLLSFVSFLLLCPVSAFLQTLAELYLLAVGSFNGEKLDAVFPEG